MISPAFLTHGAVFAPSDPPATLQPQHTVGLAASKAAESAVASWNRYLDNAVRPHLRLLGRAPSAFQFCGYTGLALGVLLCVGLTVHRDLSLWVIAVAVITAVTTSFALAMATKILLGEERLTYYHHEIAVLAMVAVVLRLVGQPVLAYLDMLVLGVGAVLCFGRIGCFMVGCCHGRPSRCGARYRPEHAEAGFPSYFVGVRLFPVQLAESVWAFVMVAVGVALVLRGAPPGVVLAWYIIIYDVGRFGFEFVRGDARPYWSGFSEAQWTSLLLLLAVVAAEARGIIPLQLWHVTAAAGLAAIMAARILARRVRRGAQGLLSARHVREVAQAADLLAARSYAPAPSQRDPHWRVNVASTSAGLRISMGRVGAAGGDLLHYTLSARDEAFTELEARVVADLLVRLRHDGTLGELAPGRAGVYHLLVPLATAGHRPSIGPAIAMGHDARPARDE